LTVSELKPFAPVFLKGAKILVGHGIMARFAGISYAGDDAVGEFGGDRDTKNEFFASVGALEPVTLQRAAALRDMGMHKAFSAIRDSARAGVWRI